MNIHFGNPPYISLRIGFVPAKIRTDNLPNIIKVTVRVNLVVVYGEVICLFCKVHYHVHPVSALDLPWAASVQFASTCHFLEIQYTRVFRLANSLCVLRLELLCVSRVSHQWHITHPSHPFSRASSFLLCFQCNHMYNLLSLNTDFCLINKLITNFHFIMPVISDVG